MPTDMTTPATKAKPRRKAASKAKTRAKRLTTADLTVEDLRMIVSPSETLVFNSMLRRALLAKKERMKEQG